MFCAHATNKRRRIIPMRSSIVALIALAALSACKQAPAGKPPAPARDTTAAAAGMGGTSIPNADPFPSTYVRISAAPFVIRNVNVMTAAGPTIRNGAVAVADGKIIAVGQTVDAPAGAIVIDGGGKYLTPGIIDVHSHL